MIEHLYIADTFDRSKDLRAYQERIRTSQREIEQLLRICAGIDPKLASLVQGETSNVLHACSGFGAATESLLALGARQVIDVDEDHRIAEARKNNRNLDNVPFINDQLSKFFSRSPRTVIQQPFTSVVGLNVSADAITACFTNLSSSWFAEESVALFTVWQPSSNADAGRVDDIEPVRKWIRAQEAHFSAMQFREIELEVDNWQERYAFIAVKKPRIS